MTTNQHRVHPKRQKRVRQALTFFSIAAWVTGVCLLILVTRMVLQYVFHVEITGLLVYFGQIHGIAFIFYLIATFNLGLKARWKPQTWFTTAIAGVVPFLSFFVEANRRKEVSKKFQLDARPSA